MISLIIKLKSMKKIWLIIASFIGVVVVTSCSVDEIEKYSDIVRVQFGASTTVGYLADLSLADTITNYTFTYSPSSITKDTVYFNVYVSGGPVSFDRYYKLTQLHVEGGTNAVEGVHFLSLNQSQSPLQKISAGKVYSRCGIVVLRDASLQQSDVILHFALEESNGLELGNPKYLWRKLTISDQLVKPIGWNSTMTNYFFGDYSKVKHRFMIDVTGFRWDNDYFTMILKDFSEVTYWKDFCKNELLKYNNNHPENPLKDENGNLVQFK
jgi:hypothetical protein